MDDERRASPSCVNPKEVVSFSNTLKHFMKLGGVTQAELVRKSNLSKTTISQMCRNSNDKGSSYQPAPSIVIAVIIALKLKREEAKMLEYAAFPQREADGARI